METEYVSRDEATEKIVEDLLELVAKRHGNDFVAEHEKEIVRSGSFLLEAYLNNVWPKMKVTWGRPIVSTWGIKALRWLWMFPLIRQDCDMCHDDPEE